MMLRKLFKLDTRWYVVSAIMIMAALAARDNGIIVYKHLISISLVSCLLEFIIVYLRDKKTVFPLSALVSGLIISTVLAPTKLFYIPAVAAILSKHLIKISGRHIFNPAAFGLLVSNVIWGLPLTWWLGTNLALIVGFGLFFAYRLKRLSLVFSFIGSLAVLSGIYSLIKHQPPLSNLGLINLFFVFFMLLEPKTSPILLRAKVLFAAIVALGSLGCFIFLPRYDFSVVGLIAGNIFRTKKGRL